LLPTWATREAIEPLPPPPSPDAPLPEQAASKASAARQGGGGGPFSRNGSVVVWVTAVCGWIASCGCGDTGQDPGGCMWRLRQLCRGLACLGRAVQ